MGPLVKMIRAKVKSGALPGATRVVSTWYGRGSRRQCIACEEPIAVFDIETEVDLEDGSVLCFHGACCRTWEAESRGS